MNKLIVSESVNQIITNNKNITNKDLINKLLVNGIDISDEQLEIVRNSNEFDKELLELEIFKCKTNINY